MTHESKVRVFIGSGEASRLERKTLIHSLRKNSRRDLDIFVFNGTHNAVEHNDEPPFLAPLSLELKYRNYTEFSLYRFLIPQLCNFEGRAIYLDSDMVCLQDIGELFDTPLNGADFLCKRGYAADHWALSAVLFDCNRCRFELPQIFAEIDAGEYTYSDFSQMAPKFLAKYPYRVGELDGRWNVFDVVDRETKLVHYTDLNRQPWKRPRHPYGRLWFEYFNEARAAGVIKTEDIDICIARAYVRPDIREGNSPPPRVFSLARKVFHKYVTRSAAT